MTREKKYRISVGLNILFLAIIVASFMGIYIIESPFSKELGDGYYVYRGGKEIHLEQSDWTLHCDEYLNFDEYIVARQGADSYYIINKATDEITGPIDYADALKLCSAKGLMLI